MISYENYANFRNSQGMKDSDVAKKAQIPQSTFSDWKKGKSFPKYEKLKKIAAAINCNEIDLMRDSDAIDYTIHLDDMELDIVMEYRKADDDTKKMISEMISFFINQSKKDK